MGSISEGPSGEGSGSRWAEIDRALMQRMTVAGADWAARQLDAARDIFERLDGLHAPRRGRVVWCGACGTRWPCATRKILDERKAVR